MTGIRTFGVPQLGIATGSEKLVVDTGYSGGAYPQTAVVTLAQLGALVAYFGNNASLTTVAGTRYYTSQRVDAPMTATGVSVLIGSTGGTDKWLVELHDAAGNLVATSALAGVTVGSAGAMQQIAFTAPVTLQPGTYFIAVQSNGTTAKIAAYNSPTSPYLTGSATGTFGTSANFTPATTYTAGVGPVALLY